MSGRVKHLDAGLTVCKQRGILPKHHREKAGMSNKKQGDGYSKSRTFRSGFTDNQWDLVVSHAGLHKANVGQLLCRAVKAFCGWPHDPNLPIRED